jgi:hypothetical protein
MSDREGSAPRRRHFRNTCTTDKVCRYLDIADEFGIEVVAAAFVGGRDWVILTRDAPIPGPAGRRILHTREE